MIKIFDINKLTLEEILSRETTATGVEEIVAGIIFDVTFVNFFTNLSFLKILSKAYHKKRQKKKSPFIGDCSV